MSRKLKSAAGKQDAKPELRPKLRFPAFWDAAGWKIKRFDELLTIGSGRDYKHLSSGDIPVYGSGGYMLSVDDYLYDGESVCIGRKGTINKPMFLTGKFWTVDTLFYTHSFTGCLPKFVFSIFQNIDWLKHNEAGGVPSLSKVNIEKIEVAVPSPAEQQKIAECLTTLDEVIAAQSQKLDALKTHKKGLMQQLFPREGETLPRLRFPEFQNAREWGSGSLGSIFDTSSGGTPDRAKEEYWNGSIPWITTSLVGFNTIIEADEFITDAGLSNSSAKLFPEKTILVAMYGQGKTRGQVAMLGIKAATNQACAAILPRKDIDPRFVFLNLGSRYEEMRRLSNSGGQENLSQGLIQGLQFSYPKDEAEQQRIADCLTRLDDLIAAQTQKLEALKTHKKGLMQQLFPSPEAVEA